MVGTKEENPEDKPRRERSSTSTTAAEAATSDKKPTGKSKQDEGATTVEATTSDTTPAGKPKPTKGVAKAEAKKGATTKAKAKSKSGAKKAKKGGAKKAKPKCEESTLPPKVSKAMLVEEFDRTPYIKAPIVLDHRWRQARRNAEKLWSLERQSDKTKSGWWQAGQVTDSSTKEITIADENGECTAKRITDVIFKRLIEIGPDAEEVEIKRCMRGLKETLIAALKDRGPE